MIREIDQSQVGFASQKSRRTLKKRVGHVLGGHHVSNQFLAREVLAYMARLKAAKIHLQKIEIQSMNETAIAFSQLVRSKLDFTEKTINLLLIQTLGKSIRIQPAGLEMYQFCALRDINKDKTASELSFMFSEVERTLYYLQHHSEIIREKFSNHESISNKMASVSCELYSIVIEAALFFKEYSKGNL